MKTALAFLAFSAVITSLVEAQFGMPPKPRSSPIKDDLPAINCGVCQALADYTYEKVARMRESAPFGKVHEDDISAVIEGACDPTTPEGRWITAFDIVEEGGYLELKKPGATSQCKEECETIAKSCSVLVNDELDVEELVVALWKNELEAEALRKVACEIWSERCSKSRVKAPEDRQDFEFEEKSAADIEMEELMASLEGMGGPGMQAYSPDDMEAMMAGGMGGMGDVMGDPNSDLDDGGFGDLEL